MSFTELKKEFQYAVKNYSKQSGNTSDYYSIEWVNSEEKGIFVNIICMRDIEILGLLAYLRDLGYVRSKPIKKTNDQEKNVKISFLVSPIRKGCFDRCPKIFFPEGGNSAYAVRTFFMFLAICLIIWMIFMM